MPDLLKAVKDARAELAKAEKALLSTRSKSDLLKLDREKLQGEIAALEAERRAALAGSGQKVSEIVSRLAARRTDLDDVTGNLAALANLEQAAIDDVARAENTLATALDEAWGEKAIAAEQALIDAIDRLAPEFRRASLELNRSWPTLSRLLESVARGCDETRYPPPEQPPALTLPRESDLISWSDREKVRKSAWKKAA